MQELGGDSDNGVGSGDPGYVARDEVMNLINAHKASMKGKKRATLLGSTTKQGRRAPRQDEGRCTHSNRAALGD
jgi:hypothetical protein